jgi:competence protein ComEC
MAGENNPYGHPDLQVLERFKKYGVGIYRTDQHGTIVIFTDGKTIEVFLEEEEAA